MDLLTPEERALFKAQETALRLGGFCSLCKHPLAGHQDLGPYTRCSAIINVEWTAKDFRCTCRGEGGL